MARKTISQRIALTGSEEIREQLKQMGEGGEKAFHDIQNAADKLKGPGAEFARSMDRAQKKIREVGEAMKRAGERARNWGAGLSVGITAPVTLLGRTFLQAASDAEEARSAFNFMFDESAEKVRDWSRTVAREMNRGSQTIQDQALSFQQLFSQVTESDAAVKLSQDFTMLAQDLSSFYNVAESDALAKLRSGLAGEAEPLRDFGVFLNAAAVEAKALELGLQKVNGAFTDQQKVVARAAVIMEQTTAAQGDAARTAGSYANQLKGLQGQWHDLQIALGELILPAALKVVQALGSLVETILSLPGPVQGVIVVISALAAAVGPILLVVGQAVMGLGFLTTGFASLMASGSVLTPVLATLAGAFGGVAAAMRGVAMLVAPMLGWPVVLAAAIGALAVTLYLRWDEIVAYTAKTFLAIEEAAAAAWDKISGMADELITALVATFTDFRDRTYQVFDQIADKIKERFDWIKGVIGSVIDWASRKLKSLLSMIGKVTGGALGGGGSEATTTSSGEPASAFAGGGRVRGPGSATSDSILARLSDGEYVVRAAAVQHYGPQLFEMLNRMALPQALRRAKGDLIGVMGAIPRALEGFASGGLVPGPLPAFADGGAAAGGGPHATLNLSIGGETFRGLMAPRETADRLIRFATSEEVKSAGRRPGWYRGD